MRYRHTLIPTLRQDPAEAEVVSHRLLVRAGMIRQVARGIYDFLPLGLRAVRKVEAIVREEMNRAGAQEILMPAVCPAELWQESGRWEHYGKELLRIKDRHERDFCFGPTHEEVVTDIVRRELHSYRDLPLTLYQIQTKFRDEVRPRFGLMRGREFIMKDAYSFHADFADCQREYQNMFAAYQRIFDRCGLIYRPVEADTGAIGGTLSHEFQVLADSGEDAIVSCDKCGYAANVEKAELSNSSEFGVRSSESGGTSPLRKVYTPEQRTIEEVSAFLGEPKERFVKTLLYVTDTGAVIAALVRGDHELSEPKLKNALGCQWVALADEETVVGATGAPIGFAGPLGVKATVISDWVLRGAKGLVCGANERDYHLAGLDQERDLSALHFADIRQARAGDLCPRCQGGVFAAHRGIEVGQTFYLGTKYSTALNATYLDAQGQQHPMEMGCYGIGITRTVAAAIEQHHDENGIIWPAPLAPVAAQIVPVNWNDPTIRQVAEDLYAKLLTAGVEVLLDDRDERPGVKFKDADLLGIPLRVTVGAKSLARGMVELKRRTDTQTSEVALGQVVDVIIGASKGVASE
ncbi:MAG: proline--tRNA ligase [Deltaproteobacteria bacterium]|nr:proline--tRNA ligase [Deltaproteobacteria bacterium]